MDEHDNRKTAEKVTDPEERKLKPGEVAAVEAEQDTEFHNTQDTRRKQTRGA